MLSNSPPMVSPVTLASLILTFNAPGVLKPGESPGMHVPIASSWIDRGLPVAAASLLLDVSTDAIIV